MAGIHLVPQAKGGSALVGKSKTAKDSAGDKKTSDRSISQDTKKSSDGKGNCCTTIVTLADSKYQLHLGINGHDLTCPDVIWQVSGQKIVVEMYAIFNRQINVLIASL